MVRALVAFVSLHIIAIEEVVAVEAVLEVVVGVVVEVVLLVVLTYC
jgi:hypothetical protein